jgi:DNA-binding transcriptional regulator GbsR (MarR family)
MDISEAMKLETVEFGVISKTEVLQTIADLLSKEALGYIELKHKSKFSLSRIVMTVRALNKAGKLVCKRNPQNRRRKLFYIKSD